MFWMPRARTRSSAAAMSSRVASMPVMCAAAGMPRPSMRATRSMVASRGLPPVRVTETNEGPSGRSASIVRTRAASPSLVFGGKNSKETVGRPLPRSALIFTARTTRLLRAALLQGLHALVLPVVVARRHGHEQALHPTVPLAPEDAEPLVEVPEMLVVAPAVLDRLQEEIVQPRHGEAQRREPELVRERVPFGQGQRTQRLVAGDQRLELGKAVAVPVAAEGVHGGGQVEDELAARGSLEVEHRDELVAAEEEIVGEQIPVDDALRELALEIVPQVLDLVVERARDPPEVARQPLPHLAVDLRDAVVAGAVFDAFLVALRESVEVGERPPHHLEPRRGQALAERGLALDPSIEGGPLALDVAVVMVLRIGERLRARERMLAEEEQQVELALHVELVLHLVDAQEEFSARRLDEVVGVHRAGGDARARAELAEIVVVGDLGQVFFVDRGVHGHSLKPPVSC